MDFHNHIMKTHGKYEIYIDKKYHNILQIMVNGIIYIKALYTIIGTYNTKKNLWIWATQAKTMDMKNIENSSQLRIDKRDEKMRAFITNNMGIYSTGDIMNNLARFEKNIGRNIVSHIISHNIQYFLIDRILLDNR